MSGAGKSGRQGVTANEYGVSLWGEKNVLELDSGNGCAMLWSY